MLITITLTSVAVFLWTKAIEAASGKAADQAFSYTGKLLRPLVNNFRGDENSISLPQNVHLAKILLEANIFATTFLVHDYCKEMETGNFIIEDWQYKIEVPSLCARLKNFVADQNFILEKPHPDMSSDPAYGKIESLLAASEYNSENILALRQKLSGETKKALLQDLRAYIDVILPPGLQERVVHGWTNGQGERLDWFEVMVFKFADLLKQPEHANAKIAFQNRLISDIKMDTNSMRVDMQLLFNELDSMMPILQGLNDNWATMVAWMGEIDTKLGYLIVKGDRTLEILQQNTLQMANLLVEVEKVRNQRIHPHLLNDVPFHAEEFMGRFSEMESVRSATLTSRKPVLLHGASGVGKSTLAKRLVEDFDSQYKHIAWITLRRQKEGEHREKSAIVNAMANDAILIKEGLFLPFNKKMDSLSRFELISHRMRNLPGPNLLIIDNTDEDILNHLSKLPPMSNWHSILTSRMPLRNLEPVYLPELDIGTACSLFVYFAGGSVEDPNLIRLLDAVGCNTLMIELMAKILRESEGKITLTDLQEALQDLQLDHKVHKVKVSTSISGMEQNLVTHLRALFDLADLEGSQLLLLSKFCLLPCRGIKDNEFAKLFNLTGDEEVVLESQFLSLYRKGWLQRDNNGFFLNQVSQLALSQHLPYKGRDLDNLLGNLITE